MKKRPSSTNCSPQEARPAPAPASRSNCRASTSPARSVDEYIQLSAIANPHARFEYKTPPTSKSPDGERIVFERSVDELPEQPEEIKPHPHGIELGTLISMLERTDNSQLGGFFSNEFCRIGPKVAQQVTDRAGLTTRSWVKSVGHHEAEQMYKALQEVKVIGPPTNCLSPIGVKTLLKGLQQGMEPEFITASSRPPAVYRGRPFVIEAGIAYGGNLPSEETAKVFRFANRVPLQYQQSACSSFKAVLETNWRGYQLQQPRNGLPQGPIIFMIHMASVWVPFTSESKEAIADYDEIRKEMKLALQDCGASSAPTSADASA
ncbi:MAG: DNA topoisomerase VI subunit B [Phycisphaerales bacterium]